eukprot:gene11051-18657_t
MRMPAGPGGPNYEGHVPRECRPFPDYDPRLSNRVYDPDVKKADCAEYNSAMAYMHQVLQPHFHGRYVPYFNISDDAQYKAFATYLLAPPLVGGQVSYFTFGLNLQSLANLGFLGAKRFLFNPLCYNARFLKVRPAYNDTADNAAAMVDESVLFEDDSSGIVVDTRMPGFFKTNNPHAELTILPCPSDWGTGLPGSTDYTYFDWGEYPDAGYKWGKALPEFCLDEHWPGGGDWNGTHGLYADNFTRYGALAGKLILPSCVPDTCMPVYTSENHQGSVHAQAQYGAVEKIDWRDTSTYGTDTENEQSIRTTRNQHIYSALRTRFLPPPTGEGTLPSNSGFYLKQVNREPYTNESLYLRYLQQVNREPYTNESLYYSPTTVDGIADTSSGYLNQEGVIVGVGPSWRHRRVCYSDNCAVDYLIHKRTAVQDTHSNGSLVWALSPCAFANGSSAFRDPFFGDDSVSFNASLYEDQFADNLTMYKWYGRVESMNGDDVLVRNLETYPYGYGSDNITKYQYSKFKVSYTISLDVQFEDASMNADADIALLLCIMFSVIISGTLGLVTMAVLIYVGLKYVSKMKRNEEALDKAKEARLQYKKDELFLRILLVKKGKLFKTRAKALGELAASEKELGRKLELAAEAAQNFGIADMQDKILKQVMGHSRPDSLIPPLGFSESDMPDRPLYVPAPSYETPVMGPLAPRQPDPPLGFSESDMPDRPLYVPPPSYEAQLLSEEDKRKDGGKSSDSDSDSDDDDDIDLDDVKIDDEEKNEILFVMSCHPQPFVAAAPAPTRTASSARGSPLTSAQGGYIVCVQEFPCLFLEPASPFNKLCYVSS